MLSDRGAAVVGARRKQGHRGSRRARQRGPGLARRSKTTRTAGPQTKGKPRSRHCQLPAAMGAAHAGGAATGKHLTLPGGRQGGDTSGRVRASTGPEINDA
ncbi:hypothetical protein OF001_U290029 [Pseudomonas sp. OF001]|nr:hypothetical protein OF001_U290029 [Pseudomonas sp. OF001]